MNLHEEALELIKAICVIPAPSGHEEQRAEFCLNWFEKNNIKGAYIDSALNTVLPLGCDGNDITVIEAHTDTVFPDMTPFEVTDDGEKLHCPGVGDDTANLAVMMISARELIKSNPSIKNTLFVCNSCEEGLGNLKGTKQIFKDYAGRISRFVTFDCGNMNTIYARAVGSERYKVTVRTEGGHSYGKFGNKNAIAALSEIIADIYAIKPPIKENRRTTYNVGEIHGGTSVNTIAQEAYMLCEFRSDDDEGYSIMKAEFERIFEKARNMSDRSVEVELIGQRPSGKDNIEGASDLIKLASDTISEVTGREAVLTSASTDCNIPLSFGVPAIGFGVSGLHSGAHTREEWVDKASVADGLELCRKFLQKLIFA